MAYLILPHRLTRQPTPPLLQINQQQRIISGAQRSIILPYAQPKLDEGAWKIGGDGPGIAFTSWNYELTASIPSTPIGTGDFAAFVLFEISSALIDSYVYCLGSEGSSNFAISVRHAAIGNNVGLYIAGGFVNSGFSCPVGRNALVVTRRNGVAYFFLNQLSGSASATGNAGTLTSLSFNTYQYNGDYGIPVYDYPLYYLGGVEPRGWSDAEAKAWIGNVWGQTFRSPPRRIYVPSAGGGGAVSVGLTGLASTGALGSLSKTVSKALTGAEASGAVGTLSPTTAIAVSLSGQAASASVGTLSASFSATLSGLAGTAAVGDLTPSTAVAVALSGLASSGSVGSFSPTVNATLPGLVATGAVGSLTPEAAGAVALSGLAATGSFGALSAGVSVALSGQAATSAVGSLSPTAGVAVALTGLGATSAIGSLSLEIAVDLNGLLASGAVGDMAISTPTAVTLSGLAAAAYLGTLRSSIGGVYASSVNSVAAIRGSRPAQISAHLRPARRTRKRSN